MPEPDEEEQQQFSNFKDRESYLRSETEYRYRFETRPAAQRKTLNGPQ